MAQRIKRPEFTWWPYRIVAIAVPLLALGAAAGANAVSVKTGDERNLEIITVFSAVLGAGNAYLFAIAVGDLGKTVLAVPAGGFAGFLSVHIFGYPAAATIYLVLLGILTLQAMLTRVFRTVLGCGGLLLLFVCGIATINIRQSFEPGVSVICVYPFICGVVAACMPYERSMGGVRSAWLAGTLNAIYGAVIASGIMFVLIIVCEFSSGALGPRSAVLGYIVFGCGICSVAVANFFCAKSLFYSVYRVTEEPDKPPDQPATEPVAPSVAVVENKPENPSDPS